MASPNFYQRTNSSKPNNDRNYFLPSEQRIGDFQKFIRRYESNCHSQLHPIDKFFLFRSQSNVRQKIARIRWIRNRLHLR